MRYRLIPGPGCPQVLCDQLNDALGTPSARRVYHAARSAYRPHTDHTLASFQAHFQETLRLPLGELDGILDRAAMTFQEAMLLPIRFDLRAR
ncbi:MAG: hypothetical protein CMK95_06310 [Pseudomonas sp.]|jgi:hypothetical protein|nr:hypothetical protein [Pseudomonas sp.]HAO73430.1 hypothetical protein [Pseudomonas sp.]HBM09285.1 hypothetical protein [Pseudomonas sp.]